MRYWTCHWQNRYWRKDINLEGQPITSSGSNLFRHRGVSRNDRVYIVSIRDGQLLLGGRMIVDRIVSQREAVRITGNEGLYPAREWAIGRPQSGTPLNLHRALSPEIVRRICFIGPIKNLNRYSSERVGRTSMDRQHGEFENWRPMRLCYSMR
jgi:hypothetical protein